MADKKRQFDGVGVDLIKKEKPVAQEIIKAEEPEQYGNKGRKGHHLKRINMGFTDSNHAYIKAEADRQGIWMSELVNNIVTAHRKEQEN